MHCENAQHNPKLMGNLKKIVYNIYTEFITMLTLISSKSLVIIEQRQQYFYKDSVLLY